MCEYDCPVEGWSWNNVYEHDAWYFYHSLFSDCFKEFGMI
jgi:hypothetical protein